MSREQEPIRLPLNEREGFVNHEIYQAQGLRLQNLINRSITSLEWMIKTIEYKNVESGMDYDSPELEEAKEILGELKEL